MAQGDEPAVARSSLSQEIPYVSGVMEGKNMAFTKDFNVSGQKNRKGRNMANWEDKKNPHHQLHNVLLNDSLCFFSHSQ